MTHHRDAEGAELIRVGGLRSERARGKTASLGRWKIADAGKKDPVHGGQREDKNSVVK